LKDQLSCLRRIEVSNAGDGAILKKTAMIKNKSLLEARKASPVREPCASPYLSPVSHLERKTVRLPLSVD
jgi:hypothetical protein